MNLMGRLLPFRSLRARLAALLIVAAAIPILLTGYISYRWIYIVQTEKIYRDWMDKVERDSTELEQKLDELGRVSQLLDVEGGIGREVVQYIESGDPYERSVLYRNISESTANVNFSNPALGAMFFYVPGLDEPILFPNTPGKISFDLDSLPLFYRQKDFTYYGPYPSLNQDASGEPVFALLRKLDYGQGRFLYAYVETKVTGLETIFASSGDPSLTGHSPVYHVLTNPSGQTAFSNLPDDTPIGQTFRVSDRNYQIFRASGQHGWTLYQLIPSPVYNHEMNRWLSQFALLASISLIAGIALAWLIWRMVYHPIRIINREISRFRYNQMPNPALATGLAEFDRILDNFQSMSLRIAELISDVEEKEKRRGRLELEKLLVQINPHFLHNTLNTIQWLARIQGQTNIAELVSIFTRVLHYNLGKKSIIVTVREEVEAVRDYIDLQNIRYDHSFNVRLKVDPAAEEVPIPRFILQPLVENALYHGFDNDEGGKIEVVIAIESSSSGLRRLLLRVTDNGKGIPAEKLAKMMGEDDDRLRRSGLGIGLRYVRKMLSVYYDSDAEWSIESEDGGGTSIAIRLPVVLKGGEFFDPGADRG
ncbi:sensor histidine kinase [Cohnella zeiphila]|uniref:histidine kinase n=1 Tax=Cohnella zeiphila TaxID=2761120 RepID=A0A7X0SJZ2_9BACL|nr:sensor histidine kinase [Cohnella zeiphila]MBB6730214.1 sensor histidine kinase [Cohnella zeiphila]